MVCMVTMERTGKGRKTRKTREGHGGHRCVPAATSDNDPLELWKLLGAEAELENKKADDEEDDADT